MDFRYILLDTQGRIPRSQWWAGVLVLIVIGVCGGVIINWLLGGAFTVAGGIALLIFQLVMLYPGYALGAKRFQDRNKPGILAVIPIALSILQTLLTLIGVMGNPFAPNLLDIGFGIVLLVIGIWFLIELGILRGTVGSNQFGPDPLMGEPA